MELWKDNHTALTALIQRSPILAEIEPLTQKLSQCAEIGLQALAALEANQMPDKPFPENAQQTLESAKEPVAEIELMVVSGIDELLKAAAEVI